MSGPAIIPRQSYPYMIWRAGAKRETLPKFRYQTEEAAEAEALDLAAKYPGTPIYILREVSRAQIIGEHRDD